MVWDLTFGRVQEFWSSTRGDSERRLVEAKQLSSKGKEFKFKSSSFSLRCGGQAVFDRGSAARGSLVFVVVSSMYK